MLPFDVYQLPLNKGFAALLLILSHMLSTLSNVGNIQEAALVSARAAF